MLDNKQILQQAKDKKLDPEQLLAAQNFMLFLSQEVGNAAHQFEDTTSCTKEEMKVLHMVTEAGSMMVKEIAAGFENISAGSLTRMLDRLEQNGLIIRKNNPKDRRSVQVVPTEKAQLMNQRFYHVMQLMAEGMLGALTPGERLLLIELCSKIQANWERSHILSECEALKKQLAS